MRRLPETLATLCSLLALGACEKAREPVTPTPLDAAVKLELPKDLVSDRLIPLHYTIEVGPGFKAPDCELTLFVHFVGPDGKKIFQDDHLPSPPSSAWTAGQTIRSTRLVVPPLLEKATPVDALAGLYCVDRGDQAFSLPGSPWKPGEWRYRIGSATLQPYARPVSDEQIAFEGWYGEEYDIPGRVSWRWLGGEAKLILANRGQPSILYLEGRVPKGSFPNPSTLRLRLGGQPLGQATTDADGRLRAIYHLTPERLGTASPVVLNLAVDQTFVPKERGQGEDTRTLGMMMTRVYYGPDTDATKGLAARDGQADYTEPPASAQGTPTVDATAVAAPPAGTPEIDSTPGPPAGAASPAPTPN